MSAAKAIPATAPPRKREPVSPMNTLAGWALKSRKASSRPSSAAAKTPSWV